MSTNTITLRISCHCKHVSYTYTLPSTAFPLKSSICSCNICRHSTGLLAASYAVIPSPDRPDVSHLTSYASSSTLTRFFCPKCGAHVGNFEEGEWEFATGLLDRTEGLLDRVLMWMEDTKDGGVASWLTELPEGMKYKRMLRDRDSAEVSDEALLRMEKGAAAIIGSGSGPDKDQSRLYASCHCGGIQFYITRPSEHTPCDKKRGKWWLRGSGNQYLAKNDSCTSCRLVTGFELISWTYLPQQNIFSLDGSPLTLSTDTSLTTLAHYDSSPGVHREFCSKCGATMFYRNDNREPQIIDIGVGLFKSESGARAEDWFSWDTGKVSYAEDAIDKYLPKSLLQGMSDWAQTVN